MWQKISIHHQARFLLYKFIQLFSFSVHHKKPCACPATQLHYKRFTRCPFPNNGCFSLVGNANCRNIFYCKSGFAYCLCGNAQLCTPYFIGIMFNQPGCGNICVNSFCATEMIEPFLSNTMARLLVVPGLVQECIVAWQSYLV